jgi:hypothetical protein
MIPVINTAGFRLLQECGAPGIGTFIASTGLGTQKRKERLAAPLA